MNEIRFEILNPDNTEDLIDYEKGLYNAFFIKDPDSWMVENYDIIDNCRMRSKIDYQDLIIHIVKQDNVILYCQATNVNIKKQFQLEKIGFTIKKDNTICEGLHTFLAVNNTDPQLMKVFEEFFLFIINNLKKQHKKHLYGTCRSKFKRFYQRSGFEIIETLIIDGEKELLIRKKID